MSVFEHLQVDSVISYLVALLMPALDAIFPALPSETAVIALGVATAGSADPRIALLVACAAAGAFLGDNLCYLLGRRFGPAVERRFFSTPKGKAARAWAERSLDRFGTQLIVVCRFIPGGRTAVTLTCGITGYPRRRFVTATAAAGVIWALYAFLIGRLGGRAFEGSPWAGLAIAFGAAIVISAVIELTRRLWRRTRGPGTPGTPGHRRPPGPRPTPRGHRRPTGPPPPAKTPQASRCLTGQVQPGRGQSTPADPDLRGTRRPAALTPFTGRIPSQSL